MGWTTKIARVISAGQLQLVTVQNPKQCAPIPR